MTRYILFIITVLFTANSVFAQKNIGVNTLAPQSLFHIDGKADNSLNGAVDAVQQKNDFIITDSGSVGIGTLNPYMKLDIAGVVKGNNYSAFNAHPNLVSHPFFFNYGGSGTWEEPVYVKKGTALGAFVTRDAKTVRNTQANPVTEFGLYGGSDIYMHATEDFGDTNKGSNMSFSTTTNGTKQSVVRMQISHDGNVGIGFGNFNHYTVKEKLEVNGKIQSANFILTSTPTYANDAAAAAGGLVAGEMYKTSAGVLMIKL